MKKYFIVFMLSLVLAACGSMPSQNIVSDSDPILNIESDLAPLIETRLSRNLVWLKNKTDYPLNVGYYFFWYDQNGVTQGIEPNFNQSSNLLLQSHQQANLTTSPPTSQSVNYRLYLRLNKPQ